MKTDHHPPHASCPRRPPSTSDRFRRPVLLTGTILACLAAVGSETRGGPEIELTGERLQIRIDHESISALPLHDGVLVEFALERTGQWPFSVEATAEIADREGGVVAAEAQRVTLLYPRTVAAVPVHGLPVASRPYRFALTLRIQGPGTQTTARLNLIEVLARARLRVAGRHTCDGRWLGAVAVDDARTGVSLGSCRGNWRLHESRSEATVASGRFATDASGTALLDLAIPAPGALALTISLSTPIGQAATRCEFPPAGQAFLEPIHFAWLGAPSDEPSLVVCRFEPGSARPPAATAPAVPQVVCGPDTLSLLPVGDPDASAEDPLRAAGLSLFVSPAGESGAGSAPPRLAVGREIGLPQGRDPAPACQIIAIPEAGRLVRSVEQALFVATLGPDGLVPHRAIRWRIGQAEGEVVTDSQGLATLPCTPADDPLALRLATGAPQACAIDILPPCRQEPDAPLITTAQPLLAANVLPTAEVWSGRPMRAGFGALSGRSGLLEITPVTMSQGHGTWQAKTDPSLLLREAPLQLQIWVLGTAGAWAADQTVFFASVEPDMLLVEGADGVVLAWVPEGPGPDRDPWSAPALAAAVSTGFLGLCPDGGGQLGRGLFQRLAEQGGLAAEEWSLVCALARQALPVPGVPILADTLRDEISGFRNLVTRQIEDDLQLLSLALATTAAGEFNARLEAARASKWVDPENWLDPWGVPYALVLRDGELRADWPSGAWATPQVVDVAGEIGWRLRLPPGGTALLAAPLGSANAGTSSAPDAAAPRSSHALPYIRGRWLGAVPAAALAAALHCWQRSSPYVELLHIPPQGPAAALFWQRAQAPDQPAP